MLLHSWLRKFRSALALGRGQRHYKGRGSLRAARHRPHVEALEDRCVPAQFAVTDLGTLGGYSSYAYDLNEAGQVVGYAATPNSFSHAFLWQNGTMIDLGTLGGGYSAAEGINDLGQVVGYSTLPGDVMYHPFLITPQGGVWFQDNDRDGRNDLMIDLGVLSEESGSGASDINNAGQVVGGSGRHAFIWDPVSGMAELGTPAGFTFSWALGINESGQVTGSADDPQSGKITTFLWDAANGMTALGAGAPYTESYGTGINDAGQVVGPQWDASDSFRRAFRWTPDSPNGLTGSFADLGALALGLECSANDINNAGQVVGWITADSSGTPHAFFWDAAIGMVDLQNQLVPGSSVILHWAEAISDGRAIAANGNDGWGDRAYLLTPVPQGTPAIQIADPPAVPEGNAGTHAATFSVSLSAASSQTVTVSYTTGDGTATAGSDYQAVSGTLTFAPGETNKTISVLVNGDRLPEPTETFVVNLSGATNATIADGQGVGTIVDDEPRLSISDVTKKEGNGKKTTLFTFTVTLSAAYDQPVTISYQTANGTATTDDDDYVAKSGTLTFAPGETTKTITIDVKGDNRREADETFYLDLFGNGGTSLLVDGRGVGTILNDD